MQAKQELKSCPFCGSEAKLYPPIRGYRAFVECTNVNCQTSNPPDDGGTNSTVSAINAWNRRAPDSLPAQREEASPVATLRVTQGEGGLNYDVWLSDGMWFVTQPGDYPLTLAAGMQREEVPSELAVWFGSMPESNGKTNWTAILHRGDIAEGFTIERSEYHDRVRYEADRVRHLIGELPESPDILAYDPDLRSPAGMQGKEQP